ncbi:MAG TPA: hypothetical protein VN281_06540 [Verrucomicrobiae bacterium]|jgi:hypothetical protein|nr:hypothetical protein [Verrucomicrobiae bacterium]
MIQLAEDCLIFRTATGEGVAYSAESISVELMGESAKMFDPEFIKHAAAAVFHYFREELGRESVTVAEFSLALEKVLRGFNLGEEVPEEEAVDTPPLVLKSDLCALLLDAGKDCELLFFPRLRDELRAKLGQSPRLLCFQGLRGCVKQLAGARRWSARCQNLHDQIVDFLRKAMFRESPRANCALVVK